MSMGAEEMRPGKKGRLALRVALAVALLAVAGFAVFGGNVVQFASEVIWGLAP
jgi:hypothetical protein